jgi:hypothetical protein
MENGTKIGILGDSMKTLTHSQMLRNNLMKQEEEVKKLIANLEAQLSEAYELLHKVEGGIEVIDELNK